MEFLTKIGFQERVKHALESALTVTLVNDQALLPLPRSGSGALPGSRELGGA